MMLSLIIGAAVVIVLAIIFFLATYRVIPPNEAHVIVFMGRGRKVKSPVKKDGVDGKTAYFFIPFLMKVYILPLTNVKLDIMDIPLNDIQMAPFICDVMAWVNIDDPVRAAERLDLTGNNVFDSLHRDLIAIVQAIARASSMKQEILDIMRDRATFGTGVSTEVDKVLESWGVALVNLEINDIRDRQGSAVIQNYESMRKAAVQSTARIEVAKKDREAIEAEQDNLRLSEVAKAESEKIFTTARLEKDKVIGIKTQEKDQEVAVAEAETNKQKVAALRVTTVGEAQVTKEAAITEAEGRSEAVRIQGEKEADVVKLKGEAEGSAIEAKGTAEAKVKDAMAEALKKFNEAGISLETIKANVEIQKAFALAYAEIAKNAEIKVVTGGGEDANILGLPMNAKTGADLSQMITAMGGVDKIKGLMEKFGLGKKTKTEKPSEETA